LFLRVFEDRVLSAVSPDTTSAATLPKFSSLDRFKAGAGVRGSLRGFWAWWMRGLASWVPQRLRTVFGLSQQRLLLQRVGDDVRLLLTTRDAAGVDALRELGRVPFDLEAREGDDPLAEIVSARVAGLPRWLLLPAAHGLRRRLTLPAAAADRLRDVLAFEIDRQTPFAADEVSYDARVLDRRGDHQIDVELVVIPKAALDRALDGLGAPLRASLAGVDMIASAPQPPQPKEPGDEIEEAWAARAALDSIPLGVNLLPSAQRRHRRDPSSMLNLVLAAVAVAALGAGLWQIRANRSEAADAFEAEAKLRSQQAKRVADEKKQLVDLVEGMRFLQNTRNGRPTTVEVLDELSRRLPNNTYVEKVSIEGDKLLVIGLSGEASRLVEMLQTSKLWRSMSLTGALQPDPRSGKDRFTLAADLAIVAPAEQKGGDDARRNR
jgi:general secretion pathway protein L